MRKTVRNVMVVCVLLPVILGLTYAMLANGEAFAVASAEVARAPVAITAVGSVKKVRLALLGSSLRWSGPEGDASFKMVIHGDSGSANAKVDMIRTLGRWTVTSIEVRRR